MGRVYTLLVRLGNEHGGSDCASAHANEMETTWQMVQARVSGQVRSTVREHELNADCTGSPN